MDEYESYDGILEDDALAPLRRNHACLQCKKRKVKCDAVRTHDCTFTHHAQIYPRHVMYSIMLTSPRSNRHVHRVSDLTLMLSAQHRETALPHHQSVAPMPRATTSRTVRADMPVMLPYESRVLKIRRRVQRRSFLLNRVLSVHPQHRKPRSRSWRRSVICSSSG